MALDKFQPYLFVSAGEQSNKYLTPVISPDGIASFQAQRAQDMTGLTIRIDPIQEGSGDPSPTNIRPISGRTGLTVTRAGKNLCEDFTESSTCIKQGEHEYKIIKTGATIAGRSANADCALKANVSYIISLTADTANISGLTIAVRAHTVDGENTGRISLISNGANEINYTPTKDIEYLNFYLGTESESIGAYVIIKNLMVRPASITDGTFEPYTATEYPITWESTAGTVYGGTLDVVSGVLTVDKIIRQCDAESNFGKGGSTSKHEYYLRNASGDETGISGTWYDAEHIICSHAANYSELSTTGIGTRLSGGQARIYFPLSSDLNTLALFKTWLGEQATAGTPLQFCYKLATPQTYQLTPTEVRTIAGYNQVYSDAGPVIDIKF